MPGTNHIVNRIELNTIGVSTQKAFKWRAQLADYLNHDFPRQLQGILNEACAPDEQLMIDRLQINIQLPHVEGTEILQQELLQALRKELIHHKKADELLVQPDKKEDIINPLVRQIEAWLYYLQNGYYPWFQQKVLTQKQVEELIQSRVAFVVAKLPLILNTVQAQQRFFIMMSMPLVDILLTHFVSTANTTKTFIDKILRNSKQSKENITGIVKRALLQLVLNGVQVMEKQFVEQLQLDSSTARAEDIFLGKKPVKTMTKQPRDKMKDEKNEAIWIQNAGLILVHPFLPVLFERLSFLNEKKEIINQAKALALVHYLLHPGMEYADANMVLPKILLGINYNDVIAVDTVINQHEKEECEELLISVIEYWEVLKKTSREGLLETFILRKGKLTKENKGWYLQVENRTEDILLYRLPWSIGYIKLPWMKDTLTTEWR